MNHLTLVRMSCHYWKQVRMMVEVKMYTCVNGREEVN